MSAIAQCANCQWWLADRTKKLPERASCHRRSPQVVVIPRGPIVQLETVWPKTCADSLCGEWQDSEP
jgi:hypothetical protein